MQPPPLHKYAQGIDQTVLNIVTLPSKEARFDSFVYLAGGAARDIILGKAPNDLDVEAVNEV